MTLSSSSWFQVTGALLLPSFSVSDESDRYQADYIHAISMFWPELNLSDHFNHWINNSIFISILNIYRTQSNQWNTPRLRAPAPPRLCAPAAPPLLCSVHASDLCLMSRRSVSRKGVRAQTRRAARWRPCRRSFQTRQTAWSPAPSKPEEMRCGRTEVNTTSSSTTKQPPGLNFDTVKTIVDFFFFKLFIYFYFFLMTFDHSRSTVDSDEEETLFGGWLCELSPAHRC